MLRQYFFLLHTAHQLAELTTMMTTLNSFEPALLSPPLMSRKRSTPSTPTPTNKTSGRVNNLLLDNLELMHAPSLVGNGQGNSGGYVFSLQPRLNHQQHSALFENAMRRMQENPKPRLIMPKQRARRAPVLPESPTVVRNNRSMLSAPPSPAEIKENGTGQTPIRALPERSNSGLARCA